MLYYSLVYSKIPYIIIWGTANKIFLECNLVKPNNILRIILSCAIYTPVSDLQRSFKFLKLEYIYELELSKFK